MLRWKTKKFRLFSVAQAGGTGIRMAESCPAWGLRVQALQKNQSAEQTRPPAVSWPRLTGLLTVGLHTPHEILWRHDVTRPQRELCQCPKIEKRKREREVTNYIFHRFEGFSRRSGVVKKYDIKEPSRVDSKPAYISTSNLAKNWHRDFTKECCWVW